MLFKSRLTEKERPTLKDLSQQLFALWNDFEDLEADFQEQFRLPDEGRKSVQELFDELANLLCEVYEARKTAVKTLHPLALGTVETYLSGWERPLDVLDALAKFLEEGLNDALKAQIEEERKEWLIQKYLFCNGLEFYGYQCIKECLDHLKDVANALAGIFVKEQIESKQDMPLGKEPSEVHDAWIRVSEAAQLADVKRGTISRLVNECKIESNGERGPERRIRKSSLLLWMDKRKERERRKGYGEYSKILDQIPEKH